jgi:hypothetical protein
LKVVADTSKWIKKADIDIRSANDFWCDRLPVSYEYFQMNLVAGMRMNESSTIDLNLLFPDIVVEPIRSFKHESGRGDIQTFTLPYNRLVL